MSYYHRVLLSDNKGKGFTLVELMVVVVISIIISAGILMALNAGEYANSFGNADLALQQEVRRALDWMIRDFRQTKNSELLAFDPSDPPPSALKSFNLIGGIFNDPQFPLCNGYNTAAAPFSIIWGDRIQYTFNAGTVTRTRTNPTTGAIIQQHFFNHINNLVFTKIGLGELSIAISGQIQPRRGIVAPGAPPVILINFALNEEVKLRNE